MSRVAYQARPGTVYLVGAGPGDPGLLTLKARDLLESCDSVLHDQLVSAEVVAMVSESAERIAVGKVGHGAQTSQADINRMLVARARAGRRVVRLKGGCPTVFGRLAEEAEALSAAGVPFEIVPGVSSALAAPAYAGIPVTHRDHASSVAIVAGHCADNDRQPLASVAHADTVIVLMGAKAIDTVVAELVLAGRDERTPAAVVSRATTSSQQTVVATLGTLVDAAQTKGVSAPAVIVVGEVVKLRDRLDWFAETTRKEALTLS